MWLPSNPNKIYFPLFLPGNKTVKQETMDTTTELKQYCQDKCPPLHIDPMDWWKTNENKYPDWQN